MKKLAVFVTIYLLTGYLLTGQIFVAADPLTSEMELTETPEPVSVYTLDQDVNEEMPVDKLPLYAGYTLPFHEENLSMGLWQRSENKWNVWLMAVRVPGAKALNVYFSNLKLRSDERLFVYTPDKSVLLGAFTGMNNGEFMATEMLPGDHIIIEFNTQNEQGELPFSIHELGVSVLDVGRDRKDFGDSGPCEVLVNCPEGDEWKKQRDGVARILVREGSSLFWCSGSLMNNTSLDGTPYFLTANHCGENSSADDYSQWVFYFNYESANCDMPNNEPAHQSLTGASLIAHSVGSTNSGSDFKLLLLSDEIPATYSVFFNGWDWTGVPSATGVTIHHPEGDLKMISTYDEYLVSSQYLGTSQDESGKYWKVFWTETESGFGVTEGGSSGSPLFSQEGYILGSLAGGKASCSATFQPDYYGKFSYSWRSNGTEPERQLKPWLDPINTGQQKLRGIYFDSTGIFADFEASTTHIKVGGLVSYKNLTEGEATGYEWYFEGGEPETSEIISPSYIEYNSAGDYDVRLVAKSLKSSDTITRKDYIHVKPTITPNPSRGKFKISFGSGLPQELDIRVTDLQQRNISFFHEVNPLENSISIDLSIHTSGIYLIKIIADDSEEVLKAFLLKHAEE